MILEKSCTTCLTVKSIDDFPPDKRQSRDGKQAKCRSCINSWMSDHYRKDPAWSMIRRAKARAKKEGMDFNLEKDDLIPLPTHCPVFGIELCISDGLQNPAAYSLDRIDNSKGYVRGNVAVMSYRANRLKNDGSASDHEAIAAWMRAMTPDNDNLKQ